MTVLKRVAMLVGSTMLVACITFTLLFVWRTGWVNKLATDLAPKAPSMQPVNVQIRGSSFVVRGDEAWFYARVSGPAGRPNWKLTPPQTGALLVEDNGAAVSFRSLEPGVFTLSVSVGGEGLQVASDSLEFENLDIQEEQPAPSVPAQPQAMAAQYVEPEPPPPTITALTLQAYGNVDSADRAAEARIVAGTIRSVITKIETGLVAPDTDPVKEIEQQVKIALGNRSDGWSLFLLGLDAILQSLRAQGDVTTAATAVPTLEEIAGALRTVN